MSGGTDAIERSERKASRRTKIEGHNNGTRANFGLEVAKVVGGGLAERGLITEMCIGKNLS